MPPKNQPYIPGLNARPDDVDLPPRPKEKTDLDHLLDDFKSGRKNSTMCLYEYCAIKKLAVRYKEEPVEHTSGMPNLGCFGCRVVVDELAYPQGVAGSKKDAKNEASKLALRVLTGMDHFVPKRPEPEVDDFQFIEVRALSDYCLENCLVYDKMMTRNSEGKHTCTVIVARLEPFVETSSDRSDSVVIAHAKALIALGVPLPAGVQPLTSNSQASGRATTPILDSSNSASYAAGPKLATNSASYVLGPQLAVLREKATYETLNNFLQQLPPSFASYDHNIAAIFITNDNYPEFAGVGKMVAFGSGNSTISVEYLTLDGRCLIDSTNIVTARRGFKRYLAQEMINCYSKTGTSIFVRCRDDDTRLKLKAGFAFHLYVSHPFDGDYKETLNTPSEFAAGDRPDASAFAHNPTYSDSAHGQLRCKTNEGMMELTEQMPDQKSFGVVKNANEMWVMSASDKLQRWNILGLQGAALTHFTDPVYLRSVTLGYHPNHDYGHLSRAVCCRLYNELASELPPLYTLNHPDLYFIPTDTNHFYPDLPHSHYSLNWNCHDKQVEVTEGTTGKSTNVSPFQVSQALVSRQCKAGHHIKWFKDLCTQDGGHRLHIFANKSPLEVKAMAKVYQTAKKAFINHCTKACIGKWIHAPVETNMFIK